MRPADQAARPTLPPREARLNRPFIHLMRLILTPAARLAGFGNPRIVHPERLVDSYRAFLDGKARLIVGFRHCYGDDPQLTGYLFHKALPRAARRLSRPLRGLTHVTFLYGSEVPLWSNRFVGWLLPNIGAVPVDHVHPDAVGMNRIRKAILDGPWPVALAPEGHVTYLSEVVAEIEPGAARFGFWCAEDLAKAGRDEKTLFLPLSLHYTYSSGSVKKLRRLVTGLEASCGLDGDDGSLRPGDAATGSGTGSSGDAKAAGHDRIPARLDRVASFIRKTLARQYGLHESATQAAILDAAQSACERILGMEPPQEGSGPEGQGGMSPMRRLYRMRAVGWDRLFRGDLGGMNAVERDQADRLAGEAWYAMRHMEVSEMLFHVPLAPAPAARPLSLLFERAVNLHDFLGRIGGGTMAQRIVPALRRPVVVAGEPIAFDELMDEYAKSRKATIRAVTERITENYEACIGEFQALNQRS